MPHEQQSGAHRLTAYFSKFKIAQIVSLEAESKPTDTEKAQKARCGEEVHVLLRVGAIDTEHAVAKLMPHIMPGI